MDEIKCFLLSSKSFIANDRYIKTKNVLPSTLSHNVSSYNLPMDRFINEQSFPVFYLLRKHVYLLERIRITPNYSFDALSSDS